MRETPIEHDVGVLEALAVEAVVVLDDELHRGDAAEVVGVEPDRPARREVGLVAGGRGERLERRAEQVAARHAVARAELLERAPQRRGRRACRRSRRRVREATRP